MFDDSVKELDTVWYHPRSFWEFLGVSRSLEEAPRGGLDSGGVIIQECSFKT